MHITRYTTVVLPHNPALMPLQGRLCSFNLAMTFGWSRRLARSDRYHQLRPQPYNLHIWSACDNGARLKTRTGQT